MNSKYSKTGRLLIGSGLLVILFILLNDILSGKGEIVLGMKSIGLLLSSILCVSTGIVCLKNKLNFNNGYRLILASILIIHFVSLLHIFPPGEIAGNEPVITIDYGFHYYQAKAVHEFLSGSGKAWGYDPYFMAGYPMGTVFDFNNKACGFFSHAFSFLGLPVAFNLFFIIPFVFMPLLMYRAARNLGLKREHGLLTALLSVLFWATDSSMRWSYYCGMFSFSIASFMSVYVFSLFYRYIYSRTMLNLAAVFIGGILLFFIPSSAFILILPLGFLFVKFIYEKEFRLVFTMLAWIAVVLITSSIWLIPFLKFYHYKTTSAQFLIGTPLTLIRDLFTVSDVSPGTGFMRSLLFRWIIIFSGIAGITIWIKEKDSNKGFSFLLLTGGFFFLAYLGSLFAFTSQLQPYRFILPLTFFLAVPASLAIIHYIRKIEFTRKHYWILAITLLISTPFIAYTFKEFAVYTPPVHSKLNKYEKDIINWVNTNTDKSGRILYEDTDFPAILVNYVDREFIGGPYMYTFIKHSFASFRRQFLSYRNDRLFDKDFPEITLPQLKEYLDLYNIKWIFAHCQDSKDYFDRFPGYIKQLTTIDSMRIYEVNRVADFFITGSGKLTAGYNKICVTGATRRETTIKYHWLETLRTNPEMKVEEVKILDDPVGFIKVHNGNIHSFTIFNSYK